MLSKYAVFLGISMTIEFGNSQTLLSEKLLSLRKLLKRGLFRKVEFLEILETLKVLDSTLEIVETLEILESFQFLKCRDSRDSKESPECRKNNKNLTIS